jgi:predicted amidohydrolase
MNDFPPGVVVTAAAIQLDTEIGNIKKNLESCLLLAEAAVEAGATWIGLPEFFNSGISWDPSLVDAIEFENGQSAQFMQGFSKKYSVVIGGSFLCRVPEGGVRNRYLCFSNGRLIGKHDKDIPTMWESFFYESADKNDLGIIGDVGGVRIGSAVCWEFMRTNTSRRMKNQVDIVMGGSHWWSMPLNWPNWLVGKAEEINSDNLIKSVQETARLIGAPIIHASHCNRFSCKLPITSFMKYHGVLEGHTAILDAEGTILAHRTKDEGEGFVIATISLGNVKSTRSMPERFWLRNRTVIGAASWYLYGAIGGFWYKKNVRNLL